MRLLILTLFFVVWTCRCQSTIVSSSATPAPSAPATYMLVAPAVIRPEQPYSVCLSLLRPLPDDDDTIIRIEVRTSMNETIAARVLNNLKHGMPHTLNLSSIPAQALNDEQKYKIYIRGETLTSGDVLFENEKPLNYHHKSVSTFIQTDRAIYRPSSLVRYRIVVVGPDLKPFNGAVNVRVLDPNQNVISQVMNVTLDRGVYSGELQLADETLLGDWTIKATPTNDAPSTTTSFTVDTYVLPKFEVNIKTSSFITVKDDLSVFVDAKYTYGKGVAGKAKVTLELPWHRWHFAKIVDDNGRAEEEQLMERTVKLNRQGEAAVVFTNDDLKSHNLLHEWGGGSIRIIASVTEDITEIERNTTHQISTYREEVKLDVEKQGDTFKPGLTYNIVVALKQMDDTPVRATLPRRVQVTTFYNYPYNHDTSSLQEEKEVKIVEVDAHGTSVLALQPPINCTSARIEAHYDIGGHDNFTSTTIYQSLYVEAAKSPSNSFLQLLADNEGAVDVGKSLSFSLKSTHVLTSITYQVMSRSMIVLSQQMNVNSEHATISFQATSQMAPKSRLIVYAIRENKQEILVDAVDFKVEGIFQNQVTLTMDKTAVQPGQSVKMRLNADPGSFIGVLGVDQSVLLLKTGNDITRDKVEADLDSYDTIGYSPMIRLWESPVDKRRKRSIWMPWWGVGGNDADSIFQNSGLVVLTDALLYKERVANQEFLEAMKLDSNAVQADRAVVNTFAAAAPDEMPVVRKLFPHTWIWTDINTTTTSGEVELELTAPDTITSWVTSAFAINGESGLGIAPSPAKLRVFRPFFIQLNLPYSVRRGEKFALAVLVFNYMEKEQDVTVTLKYDGDSGYDLLRKDGTTVRRDELDGDNVRIVSVGGGGASKPVYFPIVPTAIGDVPIEISAIASQGGDAVEMMLKVEPQGYKVSRNVPFIIELSNATFSKSLDFVWPNDVVDGSQHAHIDVIGDIMGPVMASTGKLVQMPSGCGEQNMLNLVPNILVVEYLRATKREEPMLEAKALRYIESGVQRELTYKRADNSFSAFGDSDKAGSTWLTAFVVRAFHRAKTFTFVDEKIIHRAIAFLNSQQLENGAFAEHGEIHHKDMQGGAQNGGVALTAFVLISLLENSVTNSKAIDYLEKHFDEYSNSAYTLAVVSYAAQLSKRDKLAKKAIDVLVKKHRRIDRSGAVKFTTAMSSNTSTESAQSNAYVFQARPVDIETTSYVLLAMLANNKVSEAMPIVRWLISQRNELGGFTSTQDTVMALQALSTYASITYTSTQKCSVNVSNGGGKHLDEHRFEIDSTNSIVLQSYALSNWNEPVTVTANGSGVVFAQLSYSYYRQNTNDEAPFYCSTEEKEMRAGNRLQLDLCCNYTRGGQSNMVLAEINALSGYRFDAEQAQRLTSIESLQKVEYEQDDTKMNFYFSSLGSKPICLSVYSDVVYQVGDQKPANLQILDYYDPEEQLKMTYTSKQTRSLQEKCSEDCWPPAPSTMPSDADADSSSSTSTTSPEGVFLRILCTLIFAVIMNRN